MKSSPALVLFLLLISPLTAFTQTYSGSCPNEEGALWLVQLLIRPDSSFSMTMEWQQPGNHSYDPVTYLDFHGVVHRSTDSTYVFDSRLLLSFRPECGSPRGYPRPDSGRWETIRFDSVQAFMKRDWYVTYGNVTDSFCNRHKDVYYDNWLGYPRALNDSLHILPYRYLVFEADTTQLRKAKTIKVDLGYVNPVSRQPVVFVAPKGCWPAFEGGDSWTTTAVLRNGQFFFEEMRFAELPGDIMLSPGLR